MQRLFTEHMNTAVAIAGVQAFQQAFKLLWQNVVNVDSAMRELKKVTDETASSYNQFLSDAGERAKTLGTTVSDIVAATADFAKPGYDIEEATSLADAASIYKNVGDDVNSIDEASQSIVSTMKAFNIEAENSMSIIDKFNEVSNRTSIGSAGIGDALQRSAAALAQAGNSLDESIGLIVAGNEVVQDPDVVGNWVCPAA